MNQTTPAENFESSDNERLQAQSVDAALLYQATSVMDAALCDAGLSARITCRSTSILIGSLTVPRVAVEFVFKSVDTATKVLRTSRLFDLALAYVRGAMDIVGPLDEAVETLDAINKKTDCPQTFSEYLTALRFRALKVLSPRAARNFESLEHYEIPAAAYELFLDKRMQYTCGVFEAGHEDIDTAQRAKFELIRNWFEIHTGHLLGKRHLDIGCGWGGLLAYCKENYGTNSVGNTNCEEQRQYAAKLGCEILFGDFKDICRDRTFDLVTVVGMMEHLTPFRRRELLSVIKERLAEGGLVYLQCIARPPNWIGGDIYRFAEQFVFPGHFVDTAENTSALIRRCGFEILEFAEHGHHYGYTTAAWVKNMERNRLQIVALIGEQKFRMFSGYLAFASKLFSTNRGSLTRYLLRAR